MTPGATDALAVLRSAQGLRRFERAAAAAGTAVSVHAYARGEEGLRVTGSGGCGACVVVNGLPEGHAACRGSRQEAAERALRRGRPVPFVCHMGFSCCAAPLAAASALKTLPKASRNRPRHACSP